MFTLSFGIDWYLGKKKALLTARLKRRLAESNRCIMVLQTTPLPLG